MQLSNAYPVQPIHSQTPRFFLSPTLGALALIAAPALYAQTSVPAAPTGSDATSTAASGLHEHPGKDVQQNAVPSLTPAERKELKAAHQAALKDPAVQAAAARRDSDQRTFHEAVKAAMLKADPHIAAVLEKVQAVRQALGQNKGLVRLNDPKLNLGADEIAKLRAARQSAQNDAAVAAARQQLQAATTVDQKRAAHQQLQAAEKSAMLRADPSLASVLKTLGSPNGRKRGGAGAEPEL